MTINLSPGKIMMLIGALMVFFTIKAKMASGPIGPATATFDMVMSIAGAILILVG